MPNLYRYIALLLATLSIACSRQAISQDAPAISQPILFCTPEADAVLRKLQVFPADNAFNVRIDDWPLHERSREIVASIGNDKPLRNNRDMSFILVPPNQPG